MNELQYTAANMCSTDYKDRFCAEYAQLKIRYLKLNDMLDKWDAGTLEFEPTCPRVLYEKQLRAMADYKDVLEARAKIEHVDLQTRMESLEMLTSWNQ